MAVTFVVLFLAKISVCVTSSYNWPSPIATDTVDSREFEPLMGIEKGSSYREFELSRVKLYRK